MSRLRVIPMLLLLAALLCTELAAQEAQVGVAVPLTITGGLLDTGRAYEGDPAAPPFTAGFRVLVMPQLKLGSHWYVYSAVQAWSTPFFYDETYSADREIKTQILQGFLGYTRTWGETTVGFRAGKLSSAFGAFPLRYDDATNPLIDQPLPYTYLALRASGPGKDNYGLTPVTLYGLPGAEVALSWRRLDARFQLTNSSPYNPRGLFQSDQYPQWTAGAGYTLRQGFRVGMSAYRGPWLDKAIVSYLPPPLSLSDFPASALSVDAQWARGHWNASGEWERFVFHFPHATTAPALSFGYVELKRIVSPRWYSALRANYQANNHSASSFLLSRQAYELAVGFRPNRFQLLKIGYEWSKLEGGPRAHDNVLGVQFVTSLNALSKAIK